MTSRPSVSLIVPFAGSHEKLRRLLETLRRVEVRQGDEVLIADNSTVPAHASAGGAHIVSATGPRSPGFARNRAARIAHGQWLVFIDADTVPAPSLLDDYFDPPPADATAVLAGAVVDIAPRSTLTARHGVERARMSHALTLDRPSMPYAQTANCAVRRRAFEQIGGFDERARAGEDADLCFRLQRAGWGLEERRHAEVAHASRATLAALLAQLSTHGSGAAWLNRRYPGSFPPPRPGALARRLGHDLQHALAAIRRGDREAAAFALLDFAGACAFESGRLRSNRPRRSAVSGPSSSGTTRMQG